MASQARKGKEGKGQGGHEGFILYLKENVLAIQARQGKEGKRAMKVMKVSFCALSITFWQAKQDKGRKARELWKS